MESYLSEYIRTAGKYEDKQRFVAYPFCLFLQDWKYHLSHSHQQIYISEHKSYFGNEVSKNFWESTASGKQYCRKCCCKLIGNQVEKEEFQNDINS